MDRRRTGILVLLVALVMVLVVPRGLRGDYRVGTGSAAPMPAPPAVGTCLTLDLNTNSRTTVSCDEPHSAEVTAGWSAADPSRALGATEANCRRAAADYTGVARLNLPPPWILPDLITSRVLVASPAERVRAFGWAACLVLPMMGELYRGTLRDLRSPVDLPDALGTCADRLLVARSDQLSCTEPHRLQVLASSWRPMTPELLAVVSVGRPLTLPSRAAEALTAECVHVARLLTGAEDPTYDGRLTVSAEAALYSLGDSRATSGRYLAMCTLSGSAGQQLSGSLIGQKNTPLPFG